MIMNKIIEFKNVDFRYADEAKDALNGLHLDFYEVAAIVRLYSDEIVEETT